LARDVACEGEKCVQGRDGKPEGVEHYEDVGVEGNIILKLILKIRVRYGTLRYGQVAGSCKDDSAFSCSIKCEDYLDWLRNLVLLKKQSDT